MQSPTYPRFVNWLWLIPALLGALVTLLIMVLLPPDRTLDNLGEFLFKISPLVLAVVTVALFPQRNTLMLWMLLLGIIFYMGFIDSTYILRTVTWIDAAVAGNGSQQFPAIYQFTLFVNAFTVLFALFAYRAGGATTARVLKLGLAGILVIVSGLNDLTFWAINTWPDGRPTVFTWASHVAIFIGHPPTVYDMLGFLAVHLLLIVVIMCLPIQRWIDRLAARWQHPAPVVPSSPVQSV